MTLNERLLKLWYAKEWKAMSKEKMEIFVEKRMWDKKIYVLLLVPSSPYYVNLTLCAVNTKHEGEKFKELSLRFRKFRMRLHFAPREFSRSTTNDWKQLKEKPTASFYISLNKLWTHFLIHWVGDNLLLLLTSLGPKMNFSAFFVVLLIRFGLHKGKLNQQILTSQLAC